MTLPWLLNVLGLAAGFAGTVMLYRYGLPPSVDRGGVMYLVAEQTDDDEAALAARYDRLGRIGIGLVAAAFLMQLASVILDAV